jgi:hypothetical protein
MSLDRSTVLTVLTGLEIAVLLFFLARWYGRRWGWRTTFRRIGGYVTETGRDLARPVRQMRRFGRGVRQVGAVLADPRLHPVVRTALALAQEALAGTPDAWPYAARVQGEAVRIMVAGPDPVELPGPWRRIGADWSITRAELDALARAGRAPEPIGVPVAIGVDPDGVLLLDLARTPGVLRIDGDPRPATGLACAVAAQIAGGPAGTGIELLIADGVHPRFRAPALPDVLHTAEQMLGVDDPPAVVLVCGRIRPDEREWIAWLCEHHPTLRVIVAGPYPGTCWLLPVDESGHVVAGELELSTDAGPTERGVARAMRAWTAARGRPVLLAPPEPPTTPDRHDGSPFVDPDPDHPEPDHLDATDDDAVDLGAVDRHAVDVHAVDSVRSSGEPWDRADRGGATPMPAVTAPSAYFTGSDVEEPDLAEPEPFQPDRTGHSSRTHPVDR